MPKSIPTPTPQLNRLRAAVGLIPLIESGLANRSLSAERVVQMMRFCEWAATIHPDNSEEERLADVAAQGLVRLKTKVSAEIEYQL